MARRQTRYDAPSNQAHGNVVKACERRSYHERILQKEFINFALGEHGRRYEGHDGLRGFFVADLFKRDIIRR